MEMSKLVQATPGSVIRRLFNAADGMDDAISFSIGEPSFDAPTSAIEDAVKWLRAGKIGDSGYSYGRGCAVSGGAESFS